MVQFKEGPTCSFSFTVEGDREEYIKSIRTLLYLMRNVTEPGFIDTEDIYYICRLIEAMLPDSDQVVSIEDAALLKEIKQQKQKIHENN